MKDGATRGIRARPQSSSVGLDDGSGDRKPHSQAGLLVRVEGLENAVYICFGQPRPRIPHRNHHI